MQSEVVSKEQFSQGAPFDISEILKLSSMQDVLEVLGKDEIQMYFDEYVTLNPSPEPISAKDILPEVFKIVGEPEPTYTSLNRQARDPPTDEPWAEALFAYRLKRYLEKRECTAVDWRSVYHSTSATRTGSRSHKAIALERYGITLIILERLQRERYYESSASESGSDSEARRSISSDEGTTFNWLDQFIATWCSINSFSEAT
ncbi:hypothetical protein F4806DRAFT_494264 [Annulohypoxylon nitens]|nr:hypothetical protein F4806DRAFT_494264 [Annulohypoxylon nitens]